MARQLKKFNIALWKERKYLDTWSINHFIAGLLVAVVLALFLSQLWASIVALTLFIGWELFEYATDMGEAHTNQVMDIIVDSAGFALGWVLWSNGLLSLYIFIAIAVAFTALVTWAYVIKFRYDLDYD